MAMFHLVRDLLRGGRIHWESATAVECAGRRNNVRTGRRIASFDHSPPRAQKRIKARFQFNNFRFVQMEAILTAKGKQVNHNDVNLATMHEIRQHIEDFIRVKMIIDDYELNVRKREKNVMIIDDVKVD